MKSRFDSIESVIADIRKGKMVIVVDDADRECISVFILPERNNAA